MFDFAPMREALRRLEGASTNRLVSVLLNENQKESMRLAAFRYLLHRPESKASKVIGDFIRSESISSDLRRSAIWDAGEQRLASEGLIAGLVAALRSSDPEIRGHAAEALSAISDPSAIEPLNTILTSEETSTEIRLAALRALAQFNVPPAVHPRLADILANMLKDRSKDDNLRAAAAWALSTVPHYLSWNILTDTVNDDDEVEPEDVKWTAASSLSILACDALGVIPGRKEREPGPTFLVDLPITASPVEQMVRLRPYRRYLASIREHLPQGARDYAFGPHHDCGDALFAHDTWLQEIRFEELPADGRIDEQHPDLFVRFHTYIAPDHYESVELLYRKAHQYKLETAGRWTYDEIHLVNRGQVAHEISFDNGGHWRIECEDFVVAWKSRDK
jgi:HEAT repeat protein